MDFQTQSQPQSQMPMYDQPQGPKGGIKKVLIWVIPIIIIILIAVGAWWYLTKLKEPITPFPVFSPKIPQGAQINQGNAISDIEQNLNVLPSDNNSLIQELDQLGKDITNF